MSNTKYKQVIVVDKALKMPPGKLSSQVAHASLAAVLSMNEKHYNLEGGTEYLVLSVDSACWKGWFDKNTGRFTKAVLAVKGEDALREIYNNIPKWIPKSFIVDEGRTVFNGQATATCVGIGPAPADEIDKITGHLSLY